MQGDLQRLADRLSIENDVQFFGRLDTSSEVYALMRSSTIMVQPSRREGFGIVVLEAWAAGIPVVVCAGTENAMVDLVDEPAAGVVTSPDPDSIADSCLILIERDSPERRQKLWQKASQYSWQACAEQLRRIYAHGRRAS